MTTDARRLVNLPETCGGGGLFFDFDNDGWMDIYLVNSGPSDFFTPKTPIRNALYRNNHDGTFSDVTEKAGVGCGQMGNFGMGAAAAIMTATDGRTCTSRITGRNVLFTTTAWNFHRRHRTRPASPASELVNLRNLRSTTITTASLDLFVSSFVQYSANGAVFCGGLTESGRRYYCVPRIFKPRPATSFTTTAEASHRRQQGLRYRSCAR